MCECQSVQAGRRGHVVQQEGRAAAHGHVFQKRSTGGILWPHRTPQFGKTKTDVIYLRLRFPHQRERPDSARQHKGTPRELSFVPLVLVGLIILYGAALRLNAITSQYGPVLRPAWLQALQVGAHRPIQVLSPRGVTWTHAPLYPHKDGPPTHYYSDPYTYPQIARQMHSFYGAHYREPIFPFMTKMWLAIAGNQDTAVSLASATFSVLAILTTYLLGAAAFSQGVGLAAAWLMAIEFDVITWGVAGWRDDAFMCAVLFCSWAAVRYRKTPSPGRAVVLGVSAGAACLTRLTSISFLLPLFPFLVLLDRRPWRSRLATIGVACLTASVVVGPYLFNCWRAFGDPFYAINVHTANVLVTEGRTPDAEKTAVGYLDQKLFSRPARTVDSLTLGLTTYPFQNKWQGFDPWMPALGRWLARAALVGLFLMLFMPNGRLLLVVLATALAPFAVTWQLAPDWRFTEFAYPFFLIAACVPIDRLIALAVHRSWPSPLSLMLWGSVAVGLASIAVAFWLALPALVVREAIAAGEDTSIAAGSRDTAFFTGNWSAARADGNVTLRAAVSTSATVLVPLPASGDYSVTLRLDPFPRPADDARGPFPAVQVFVNDQFVRQLDLTWNPHRVGAYDLPLPRQALHAGTNRLRLAASQPASFAVWYVRVHPGR